jgi:hypothetical protein
MFKINLRKLCLRLSILGVLTLCIASQGSLGTSVNNVSTCCLDTCCSDCSPIYVECRDTCAATYPTDPVAEQACKDQCLVQRTNCNRRCDVSC